MRRAAKVAAIVLGVLLALVVAVLFFLLETGPGRRRVQRFAISKIQQSIHGKLTVPRVTGNALSSTVMHDVTLTDEQGRPFLKADEIRASYDIRSFFSKKIYLSHLELVSPTLVLSRPPDQDWNFVRIFRGGGPPTPGQPPGFGAWVRFRDVVIRNGDITVRERWAPPDSLPPAARRRRVQAALAGDTRWRVERVPGGYQRVMRFRDVDARLPVLRLADPDSAGIYARVASASMTAEPFLPPAAHVRGLAGRFHFVSDTLTFQDTRLRLPGSVLTGSGVYTVHDRGLRMEGSAQPLRLADVQFVRPSLPDSGVARFHAVVVMRGDERVLTATGLDAAIDGATAHGRLGLMFGDSLRLHDTDLTFAGVRTSLLERLLPGLKPPRRGTLSGRLAATGRPSDLSVSGDVRFADAADGVSRVGLDGRLAFQGPAVLARGLRLRMHPLQVSLARALDPALPLTGTLTGTATANGSTKGKLTLALDVAHHGKAGLSRLTGDVALSPAGGPIDARVRVHPLALATVGRFVPAARLHGVASGPIRARGTLADLRLDAALDIGGGGTVHARGTVDLKGTPAYDIDARMTGLDLAAVTTRAPRSALSGTARLHGHGAKLATMNATVAADLSGASVEGVGADAVHLRARVADGLAVLDSTTATLASGRLALDGRFGLAAGRDGTLSFTVNVDSLRDFARWLPGDTGVVAPRPARMAGVIALARADSLRTARATEVQRAATGQPPEPKLAYDTIPALPKDSLAGSLRATGTLKGNVKRFDVAGSAEFHDLVMAGAAVGDGAADFSWLGAPSAGGTMAVEAGLDSVRVAGFALDSARVKVRQTGLPGRDAPARGTATIAITQDDRHDYRVAADYVIELDRKAVKLNELAMRFDSLTWRSTRPGSVVWGGSGFALEHVELVNGHGGRVFLDGRLPKTGSADLKVALDSVQIANVVALLQDSIAARGLVSLHAEFNGTQAAPRISGDASLSDATYHGAAVPATTATFKYADATLSADARMLSGSRTLVTASGTLPIDLALSGGAPRLLDRPVRIDLQADSLPVDLASRFTSAVSDVHGRVRGTVAVRGTTQQPQVSGDLLVDMTTLRLAATGVMLHDIHGRLALSGDSMVVDSLVATSGGRPVHVRGGVGLATLTRPVFDLTLDTRSAVVLNNQQGNLRADATLKVEGPFDAVHVTGDVDILGGVIYLPQPKKKLVLTQDDPAVFAVLDTTIAAQRALLPHPSPLLANLRLDVNVRVERDTWVRNSDANVEVYTPDDLGPIAVHMNRATGTLSARGVVNTERGDYLFMGRRFTLKNGSAQFVGEAGANPLLQITAAHPVKLPGQQALEIRVLIGGTLDAPRLSLESDAQPPIAQSDLLSYIAFGRSASSLLQQQGSTLSGPGTSSGNLVGSVAAMATQQLAGVAAGVFLGDVAQEATRQLGLDVFTITPADVPAELTTGGVGSFLRATEIRGGKYLNSRTFVSVQLQGPQAPPGVRLEYLTPRGYGFNVAWEPRYLPQLPSLSIQSPVTTSVFGLFLFRQWKF